MSRQLRLEFGRRTSFSRADFAVGASNRQALGAVEAWPNWTGGCLAVSGPSGVGKTHLAHIWTGLSAAHVLDRRQIGATTLSNPSILIEDVDQGIDSETLFHLINVAARGDISLMLTARIPPFSWSASLPDLRSRLNAMPVAQVLEPDDAVLEAILRKHFAELSLRPPDDLIPYLLRRMERSAPAARDVVMALDELADLSQRPISCLLAKQILEKDAENIDHFE